MDDVGHGRRVRGHPRRRLSARCDAHGRVRAERHGRSQTAGVAAVGKAAKAQNVPPAGAKAAFKRAPYSKTALRYLYALGWIGGTRNPGQCGLTLLGEGAARDQAASGIRANAKFAAQLKRRSISVGTAANALTKGVVSACA